MSKDNQAMFTKKLEDLYQVQPWSLGTELEKWVLEKPDHPAVIFKDEVITYIQFDQRANCYMNLFGINGFVKGDVVALVMSNRPQLLMIVAGLSKLGIISAIINPEMRGDVLAASINIAEPRAVVIGSELLDLYKSISSRVRLRDPAHIWVETSELDLSLPDNFRCLVADQLDDPEIASSVLRPDINTNDTLAYLYTSGTFGPRKAVPIDHRRFLAVGYNIAAESYVDENSIQYVSVPLYLNSGFNVCMGSMIATGSTIVLEPLFSVNKFWSIVRKWGVNCLFGVGEMFRYLLNKPEQPDDADNPVKIIMCNGMLDSLIEPFCQRFGIEHMIELYGTTEGVGFFHNASEMPGLCGNLYLGDRLQGAVVRCNLSTGEIMRNSQGYAEKCEVGERGILLSEINSLNQFDGYVNDEEETARRVITDVFVPGDKYFNTCDLMELCPDNNIAFIDHFSDSYRWRGKTVSAQQVADVLLKFYGAIEDVVVFGVRVPGHEGRCGMAVISINQEEKLDWAKFTDHINRRMPEHARPVFLRITESADYSELLSEKLVIFKKESYLPSKVKDQLLYYNLEKNKYIPFTLETYEELVQRKLRV